MSATPRPWTIVKLKTGEIQILGHNTGISHVLVAETPGLNISQDDDAALIVRAVNAFDEAKAVLGSMVREYSHIGHSCWPVDPHNADNLLDKAKAVLARMEGIP